MFSIGNRKYYKKIINLYIVLNYIIIKKVLNCYFLRTYNNINIYVKLLIKIY